MMLRDKQMREEGGVQRDPDPLQILGFELNITGFEPLFFHEILDDIYFSILCARVYLSGFLMLTRSCVTLLY